MNMEGITPTAIIGMIFVFFGLGLVMGSVLK